MLTANYIVNSNEYTYIYKCNQCFTSSLKKPQFVGSEKWLNDNLKSFNKPDSSSFCKR